MPYFFRFSVIPQPPLWYILFFLLDLFYPTTPLCGIYFFINLLYPTAPFVGYFLFYFLIFFKCHTTPTCGLLLFFLFVLYYNYIID